MQKNIYFRFIVLVLVFVPLPTLALTLTDIQFRAQGPDVLVALNFDTVPPGPHQIIHNDSNLIVFELPEYVSRLDWTEKVLNIGQLSKIMIEATDETSPQSARVVFEVKPGTGWTVHDRTGSQLLFRFFQQPAGNRATEILPVSESEKKPDLAGEDLGGADNYRIGPEDVLHISVFELPDLKQTVRVNEDGTINLHPLGAITAENHTTLSLARKLAELFEEKYVKDPKVLVSISEFRSRKVSIIGSVKKPGEYYLRGQRNLLQLIAQAGGITADAGKSISIIRSGTEGDDQRITIDIDQLMTSFQPELNISLKTSDIVYVPLQKKVAYYVYGAVNRPGAVTYSESEHVTILKLLAEAGGLRDDAATKRIMIHRQKADGTRQTLKVNVKKILKGKLPDPVLEPEDILVVPISFF